MSAPFSSGADVDVARSAFDFRPLHWLRNGHVQTVLGQLLPGPPFTYPTRRHVVWLPDGDGLVLHDTVPANWQPGDRIAILVHGLTGSHASAKVRRLARLFLAERLRAVRLDLRGAGKGLPLARLPNHAGRSDDVRAALAEVHRWSPASPLLLIGLSLGGNLALKLAGEAAEHPVPGLDRVASLGPPIDLERCATRMEQRHNRLYESYFVRALVAEARQRQRFFPDLPPLHFPRRLSMRLFDELYTAPRCGFANALDYYRRASAMPLVGRILVPTLILIARDDPFIAVEPFEELVPTPQVTAQVLTHGGHLGFLGWDGLRGFHWAERRLVDWTLCSHEGDWCPPKK